MDEGGLDAWSGRKPDGNMAIVVMVVSEHDEDAFAREESRCAVGELFGGIREAEADAANTIQVRFRF